MSSPHVAGAALLLRAAHPNWRVDDVISALETTAEAAAVRNDDDSPASTIDSGAGAVRVDRAARIGLTLRETRIRFIAANPATSSSVDPGGLNLPGIASDACVSECSFARTLTALQTGSWTLTTEGELDIEVSPASLSLQAGEQQQIEVTIRRGEVELGQWGRGSVVLTPASTSLVTQRLAVGARIAAGELPDVPELFVGANRGREDILIENLVDLEELVIRTSALTRAEQREVLLPQDPANSSAFNGEEGTFTEFFEVPAGTLMIQARTFQSTAVDIDLFVGRDDNGDGRAQEEELVCRSITPDDIELCRIEQPEPGTWWVRVQNWRSSLAGEDQVPFDFVVLTESDDPSLTATAPGRHPGGNLTVPVYWDQPAMARTEHWEGVVVLASSPDEVADIGMIPLSIRRFQQNQPAETALFNDQSLPVALAANSTHDRLYIDVPTSANRLQVEVQGDLNSVSLRRLGFDDLLETVPLTPPAPAQVLAEASRAGNTFTIDLQPASGANLEAGRYYVVLTNNSAAERFVEVRATVSEVAPV
ncbi:MAG: hypothetical protein ACNA7E_05315, partial [Wenzhouxiangellaceae bacterium]